MPSMVQFYFGNQSFDLGDVSELSVAEVQEKAADALFQRNLCERKPPGSLVYFLRWEEVSPFLRSQQDIAYLQQTAQMEHQQAVLAQNQQLEMERQQQHLTQVAQQQQASAREAAVGGNSLRCKGGLCSREKNK